MTGDFLFFSRQINAESIFLQEDESKHCISVLRRKNGDIIKVADGLGHIYEAQIINDHPKKCEAKIISTQYFNATQPKIHLAIAPTKSMDRIEWVIEKLTEIGVNEFSFIICDRSERRELKMERVEKIVLSAFKQSKQFWIPKINPPQKLKDFAKNLPSGQKFVGYCETGNEEFITKLIDPTENLLVLIGPEGDFSENEIKLLSENGVIPVSLGKTRLRTETAALVAGTLFLILNNE